MGSVQGTSEAAATKPARRIGWAGATPFIAIHLLAFGAIWTGITPAAAICCAALYFVRMFAVTGVYHRYFSHRTYKTSRVFQFLLAFLAQTSAQRGALWWAAHHRHHHRYSDMPQDCTRWRQDGFWYSHMLVDLRRATTRRHGLQPHPGLRALPGAALPRTSTTCCRPSCWARLVFFTLGASGLFFGFFASTVLLWHGTFTINSLSHVFGKRRFATTDHSRNNWLLAIVTWAKAGTTTITTTALPRARASTGTSTTSRTTS